MQFSERNFHIQHLLADLGLLTCALSIAGMWSRADTGSAFVRLSMYLGLWILITQRLHTYRGVPRRTVRWTLLQPLEATLLTLGAGGLFTIALFDDLALQPWMAFVAALAAAGGLRLAIAQFASMLVEPDEVRVLMIGAGRTPAQVKRSVRSISGSLRVLGFVPFPEETVTLDASGHPTAGNAAGLFQNLSEVLISHRAELAVIAPGQDVAMGDVRHVFSLCDEVGMSVQYFPPFLDLHNLRVSVLAPRGKQPDRRRVQVELASGPNEAFSSMVKRSMDLVGALFGCLILAPVFLACAIAVKLQGGRGPVFYRQRRTGMSGQEFDCLKFRTMVPNAHLRQEELRQGSVQDGPAFKIPDDPRITKIGKFLRKYSLDELPQLFNILRGEMSLVGPRPPTPDEVVKYDWWQRRRLSVKPGLTCIWQVEGRNRVSFKRWMEMDLEYIDNWSPWLDVKLICRTFHTVLRGTGM